jgi:hypothetical protein
MQPKIIILVLQGSEFDLMVMIALIPMAIILTLFDPVLIPFSPFLSEQILSCK